MPHKIPYMAFLYNQICYHGNQMKNGTFFKIGYSPTTVSVFEIRNISEYKNGDIYYVACSI